MLVTKCYQSNMLLVKMNEVYVVINYFTVTIVQRRVTVTIHFVWHTFQKYYEWRKRGTTQNGESGL